MESRIRIFLLRGALAALCLATAAGCGSRTALESEAETQADLAQPIIEPQVARRDVAEPKVDTEDFEIGAFIGVMSVEDFGSNTVYGTRLAYHVSESLFAEASYGTTDTELTSYERLSGGAQLLTDDQREYEYYSVAVGYNLLPGEVFIGRDRAFNSALYVIAGAGNTSFADDDFFTMSFGAGWRVLATDSIALHFDMRDYMFDSDLLGEDKTTHNIQFDLGATWFF